MEKEPQQIGQHIPLELVQLQHFAEVVAAVVVAERNSLVEAALAVANNTIAADIAFVVVVANEAAVAAAGSLPSFQH